MTSDILAKVQHRKTTPRKVLLFILAMPLLALASWFLLGTDLASSADHPGGSFLEISFWATSLGASFLSFIMLEILFRSEDTRVMASWPVKPLQLFIFQMKRVFGLIIASSLLYFAFWAPQMIVTPLPVALSALLWPVGLCICAAVAAAIIVYTGNAGTKEQSASFGAMAFSMAPAIALAVSLMTTLLLKLLVEALLKPGFEKAAFTAFGITLGVFVVAMLYAARVYHKRYYAILASFIDTDLVVLNANYDFLDNKKALEMRAAKDGRTALVEALCVQYQRKNTLSTVLIATFAVILCLLLWSNPDYFKTLFMPFLAVVPWVLFSKPWYALKNILVDNTLVDALPISKHDIDQALLISCFKILPVPACLLAVAVLLPGWMHLGIGMAAMYAVIVLGLCAASAWGLGILANHRPGYTLIFSVGVALILAFCGVTL